MTKTTTEENGRNKRRSLGHAGFYDVCEALKTHRERFTNDRPSQRKAAVWLGTLTGHHVTEDHVREAMEKTGVSWEGRRRPRAGSADLRRLANRTLATAVVRLYRKLGEEVPSSLLALYQDLTCRGEGQPQHQEATTEPGKQDELFASP